MNSQVRRCYRKFDQDATPLRVFHDLEALHELSEEKRLAAAEKAEDLPHGWLELSRLPSSDRVVFVREFWLQTLPYVPHIHRFLESFFDKLDDIGVYVIQPFSDTPFESEMVYSLRDGSTFFHGRPPLNEEGVAQLRQKFQEILPEEYLAFLSIHEKFSKNGDTGFLPSEKLCRCPGAEELIPFYESFGQRSYQCFHTGWAPSGSLGNVFYAPKEGAAPATSGPMAFSSFLDWLALYMEGIEEA